MDSFVKQFLTDFSNPGLSFGPLSAGMVRDIYVIGNLKVEDGTTTRNRRRTFSQPMTMLGRVEAKKSSPTAIDSAHMGSVRLWDWTDNHVSLIANAMRYVLIAKTIECGDAPGQALPAFNDGRVRVDRNQWWGDYPAQCTWDFQSWPGGAEADHYPTMTRLTECCPDDDTSVIDLRGLTGVEARFILLMLGGWARRSRMRIDFELGKLTDNVLYRSDVDVPAGLTGWIVQPAADPHIPAPPNSTLAWTALTKYVARNRLFDHFSVVIHLMSTLMYQMLPTTADGQIWLSYEWTVSLPAFSSIRGRYTFLNEEDPAFASHRPLNEWSYFSSKLEKFHLAAVAFVQAAQTGMAIRAVRHGLESDPQDLYNTYDQYYYQPHNFIAASVSEATRKPAPSTGMSGVYVNLTEDFDVEQPDRTIMLENVNNNGLGELKCRMGQNNRMLLTVPWTTFAGMPTLILPLDPFPYSTVLKFEADIEPSIGTLERRGFRVRSDQAWLVASFYKMAGHNVSTRFTGEVSCDSGYRTPDNVGMTWPVLFNEDEQDDDVIITGQTPEAEGNAVLDLPPVHNNFFKGFKLKFKYTPMRRGVAAGGSANRVDVIECGGVLAAEGRMYSVLVRDC